MKKFSCKECGAKVSIEEMEEAKGNCPVCKKETSWFSEPEFFINDELKDKLSDDELKEFKETTKKLLKEEIEK